VITSSIVITMEFPEENVRTQTRRIRRPEEWFWEAGEIE